jgi:hypothetical protein
MALRLEATKLEVGLTDVSVLIVEIEKVRGNDTIQYNTVQ